jgi:ABC-type multidrug transport system ATPase subunit
MDFKIWADNQLYAGDRFEPEILSRIGEAQVIILLISAYFNESSFCYTVEMKEAFAQAKQKRLLIIPVLLREVNLTGHPYADLQSLPEDPRYLSGWPSTDAGCAHISAGIQRSIENFVDELTAARRVEITQLALDGNLEQACKRLMDFAREFSKDPTDVDAAAGILAAFNHEVRVKKVSKDEFFLQTAVCQEIFTLLNKAPGTVVAQGALVTPGMILTPGTAMTSVKEVRSGDASPAAVFSRVYPQTREEGLIRDTLITAKQMVKKYKRSHFELTIDHVQIRAGSITGIVGKNGSGKTTLLKLMAGILAQDEGDLSYPNIHPGKPDWPAIKSRIGYLPQELDKVHGKVLDSIWLNAILHGMSRTEIDREIRYFLPRLGIDHKQDARWNELSGGFRLKFALASILICKPRVILLDEPLANLDIESQQNLLEDLKAFSASLENPIGIVLSSQQLREVQAVASHMVVLSKGRVTFSGMTADLGEDLGSNSFELGTTLSEIQLREKLAGLVVLGIEKSTSSYIITTPREITLRFLTKYLVDNNITFDLIKDDSSSTKRYF